jgi:hypothetical protein
MFDDPDQAAQSRCSSAFIRLNVDHWDWCRAVLLLEAMGGCRSFPGEGTVYRFITSVAWDDALRLVRARFGWIIATPFDGYPWFPGVHCRGTVSRNGGGAGSAGWPTWGGSGNRTNLSADANQGRRFLQELAGVLFQLLARSAKLLGMHHQRSNLVRRPATLFRAHLTSTLHLAGCVPRYPWPASRGEAPTVSGRSSGRPSAPTPLWGQEPASIQSSRRLVVV